ncbi:MAG: hypothetical protein SGCHY_004561 [Lobulomycetales sp.]
MYENCSEVFTVRRGDTCFKVSREKGISLADFLKWNAEIDCLKLHAGDELCVSLISVVVPESNASAPSSNPLPSDVTTTLFVPATATETTEILPSSTEVTNPPEPTMETFAASQSAPAINYTALAFASSIIVFAFIGIMTLLLLRRKKRKSAALVSRSENGDESEYRFSL